MKKPNLKGGFKLRIPSNARVFFAGKTRSGKTTAAMLLLAPVQRLLVVDSKDGLGGLDFEDYNPKLSPDKIRGDKPYRIRVVENDLALQALQVVYERGDSIVFIDEINALIPPRSNPPQVVLNIWQRGASRNIGGWSASQRPVSIPVFMISESEYFFIFKLNRKDDRESISDNTTEALSEPVKNPHGFWYYDIETDRARYFEQMDSTLRFNLQPQTPR